MSTILSFEEATQEWRRHIDSGQCKSTSDICDCRFDFSCTNCGDPVVATGENMGEHVEADGQCMSCFYDLRPTRKTYDVAIRVGCDLSGVNINGRT